MRASAADGESAAMPMCMRSNGCNFRRYRAVMTRNRGRRTARQSHWRCRVLVIAFALASVGTLTAGCEASREGTALLHNATDQASLEIVLRDPAGQRYAEGTLEEVYVFDTQFTNREKQCLVGRDGGFEVLRPNGEVIASHRFDDRPVCELDELVLEDDGSLVWE
jgi:hypothetical protein